MEISFEKGKFVYCPNGFNYQEVLDDFKRAKKVRIITYNISGTGNVDPLLEQIKKLGEDVDVQIITNIPSRFETYHSSVAGEAMRSRAKHNIEVYLKKLNPESFTTAFSISFNFSITQKLLGRRISFISVLPTFPMKVNRTLKPELLLKIQRSLPDCMMSSLKILKTIPLLSLMMTSIYSGYSLLT